MNFDCKTECAFNCLPFRRESLPSAFQPLGQRADDRVALPRRVWGLFSGSSVFQRHPRISGASFLACTAVGMEPNRRVDRRRPERTRSSRHHWARGPAAAGDHFGPTTPQRSCYLQPAFGMPPAKTVYAWYWFLCWWFPLKMLHCCTASNIFRKIGWIIRQGSSWRLSGRLLYRTWPFCRRMIPPRVIREVSSGRTTWCWSCAKQSSGFRFLKTKKSYQVRRKLPLGIQRAFTEQTAKTSSVSSGIRGQHEYTEIVKKDAWTFRRIAWATRLTATQHDRLITCRFGDSARTFRLDVTCNSLQIIFIFSGF